MYQIDYLVLVKSKRLFQERLNIEQASSKIRAGPPGDDAEDRALPVWAGEVPVELIFKEPLPDPAMDPPRELPESIKELARKG